MKTINTRKDFFVGKDGLIIAELGVFEGDFSKEILSVCTPEFLFMVDIFEGSCECTDTNKKNRVFIEDMSKVGDSLAFEYFYEENIAIIKKDSREFLKNAENNFLDIVYIDTLHEYQLTSKELELCRNKVKPNGWITGHDYFEDFKGVMQAVDEFCAKYNLQINIKTTKDICTSYFIKNIK